MASQDQRQCWPLVPAKEEMMKRAKLDAFFALLMEDFLDVAELGLSKSVLDGPLQLQSLPQTCTQKTQKS